VARRDRWGFFGLIQIPHVHQERISGFSLRNFPDFLISTFIQAFPHPTHQFDPGMGSHNFALADGRREMLSGHICDFGRTPEFLPFPPHQTFPIAPCRTSCSPTLSI
jgi:hypothetical protein